MRINILLLVLSVFLLCPSVFGQEPDKCDHTTSSEERFQAMRIAPPSKVTYYDGITLEISYSDTKAVYIRKFDVDKDSIVGEDFKRGWKKDLWWVIYCVRDNHLYTVTKVSPNQLK